MLTTALTSALLSDSSMTFAATSFAGTHVHFMLGLPSHSTYM